MANIFDLSAEEFRAVLPELASQGVDTDALVREYRRKNSALAPVYGLIDRVRGGDAEAGRERANILPMTRPAGTTGLEALLSGEAELAVPGALLGAAEGAAMGVDAPAAASRGLIPMADAPMEALGTAGSAMLGGGAAAAPRGSLRSGAIRTAEDALPAARNEAERMARDILELRAAGRASEVTDEMMAQADPQYMFNNTPLPMDEASRMARAQQMGFRPDEELYHGSGADFSAFELGKKRFDGTSAQVRGPGVYLTEFPSKASSYAPRGRREGGQVYDVLENTSEPFEGIDSFDTYADRMKYLTTEGPQDLADYGFDANKAVMGIPIIFDPRNIRSRFARFDPEFSHLANLSAANASPGVGLLQMYQQQQLEERARRRGLLP